MDDYFAGPVGVGVTILLKVLEARVTILLDELGAGVTILLDELG